MPMDPAAGVPARVAVSFPLSKNVTPVGREPISESWMSAAPLLPSLERTGKVPAWPTVNMVVAAETFEGADWAGVFTVTSPLRAYEITRDSPQPIVPAKVSAKGLSPAAAKATVLLEFVDDWA